MSELDTNALGSWLWDAACTIRGALDAPKYKDYILPLIFLKRLSDVFDDEVEQVQTRFRRDREQALKLIDADHELVRFYISRNARWGYLRELPPAGLGEKLTEAVRAVSLMNESLRGVIDIRDFNERQAGQRILDDGPLHSLVNVLSRHRLGINDVEPDVLGRAYEYLLRKFAEGQGQSAGEFYTPAAVGRLMAALLRPEPGQSVYDPTCGSSGLLIKCHLRLLDLYGEEKNGGKSLPHTVAPLQLYGQEINHTTYAMARMNTVIHQMEADIRLGDTMRAPAFLGYDGLERFDLVTANPMWNQKFPATLYENDKFERFEDGIPPSSSADWGWIQHMYSSVHSEGRMAVVLDTGAVSRGSGNAGTNKERDIRKAFVERDEVEAVILLPENLFFNTTAPGIIVVFNRAKARPGEIMLVNASALFIKGRPKNEMLDEHVAQVVAAVQGWALIEELAEVISLEDARRNDYNISPSRHVANAAGEAPLSLEDALVLVQEAEEARVDADRELDKALGLLGLSGWRNGNGGKA